MHNKGWQIIGLEDCYAEHLTHLPHIRKKKYSPATKGDIENNADIPDRCDISFQKKYVKISNDRKLFWKASFLNCFMGILLRLLMSYTRPND